MQLSTPLSRAPSETARPVLPKWLLVAAFLVAFFGFVDTTYLTIKTLQGESISCSLTQGCTIVTTSVYSHILGIPIALLGALYYFAVLVTLFFYSETGKIASVRALGWFSAIPFVFSVWLTYVQWQVLEAFCQYCLFSAMSSTLLFIFGIGMLWYTKKVK